MREQFLCWFRVDWHVNPGGGGGQRSTYCSLCKEVIAFLCKEVIVYVDPGGGGGYINWKTWKWEYICEHPVKGDNFIQNIFMFIKFVQWNTEK